MGFGGGNEVCRHQPASLVQQLIEGMLAVDACCTPENRGSGRQHRLAVTVDRLAVRLHVELLQIGRQGAQIVVIGQHCMTL